MKKLVAEVVLGLTAATVVAITSCSSRPNLEAQTDRKVTKATVDRWMRELSNWGRWGKEDERGTLNLLTPETRKQALSAAKEGFSVSLSHNYLEQKADDVMSPFVREMVYINPPGPYVQFAGDRFTVEYHGFAHSHMDALCHDSYEGKIYNGFPGTTVTKEAGCTREGITNFKQGVVARGLLIDIPRLRGVQYLEPSTPIYVEDIEAWEKQARIKAGPGDVLLVRTGRWARRAEKGAWAVDMMAPGLHASVLPWLRQRDIAILGSDAVSDALPSGVEGVIQPVHQFTLVALGMPLFDNLDLEAVAEEAAKRGRWEFLLTAAPLAVEHGTGSPLNPLAIF
jgi:kynurenine formamidase